MKTYETLTAKELIAKLAQLPPDTRLYTWLDDGSRLPVTGVDDAHEFVTNGFADIMVHEYHLGESNE